MEPQGEVVPPEPEPRQRKILKKEDTGVWLKRTRGSNDGGAGKTCIERERASGSLEPVGVDQGSKRQTEDATTIMLKSDKAGGP